MIGYPKILHTEEAMRDGLQIEDQNIPVEDKIRLLDALSETGLKEIAVGSFVSAKWTPQMACMDDLVRGFHPKPGIRYTYTALNEKGYERARAFTPPLSVRVIQSATRVDMCDVFAQRNNNRTKYPNFKFTDPPRYSCEDLRPPADWREEPAPVVNWHHDPRPAAAWREAPR